MRRLALLVVGHWALVIAAAFAPLAPTARASTSPASPASASATASAPSAADDWLVTLHALLADRYRATGELRLAWHRPLPVDASRDADLELLQAPATLAPQLLVTVRARAVGGRTTDHSLLLRAELWREGYSLRQPAPSGTPLAPDLLDPVRFDALRDRDALVLDPAQPLPELDFARAVPAGRLLVWRDVLRRPLVRRGQPVDVVASDGVLVVSLRAVALHDAARGESVRVRNPDSRREFTATCKPPSGSASRAKGLGKT